MGFPDITYRPAPDFQVRFGAIGEAWGLFKDEWAAWVVAGLMVTVGNWALLGAVHSVFGLRLPEAGGGFRLPVPPAEDLVPAVIVTMINGFLLGGMFRLACNQVRGLPIRSADVLGVVDVLGELALGSALLGAGLAASATFCAVVPAFILAGVWMFVIPLIVEARLRAFDAFALSWQTLKGQWFTATVFHLVASLIAGLGFCCGCLWIFVTMPLYCLSIAVLYRDAFLGKGQGSSTTFDMPDRDF